MSKRYDELHRRCREPTDAKQRLEAEARAVPRMQLEERPPVWSLTRETRSAQNPDAIRRDHRRTRAARAMTDGRDGPGRGQDDDPRAIGNAALPQALAAVDDIAGIGRHLEAFEASAIAKALASTWDIDDEKRTAIVEQLTLDAVSHPSATLRTRAAAVLVQMSIANTRAIEAASKARQGPEIGDDRRTFNIVMSSEALGSAVDALKRDHNRRR